MGQHYKGRKIHCSVCCCSYPAKKYPDPSKSYHACEILDDGTYLWHTGPLSTHKNVTTPTPTPTPEPTPEPTPTTDKVIAGDLGEVLRRALDAVTKQEMSAAIEKALESIKTPEPKKVNLTIHVPEKDLEIDCSKQHKMFPKVVYLMLHKVSTALVGASGSGKSMLLFEVAKSLGIRYGTQPISEQTKESTFKGTRDAHGAWHESVFVDFWRNGGLFNVDEVDNANPNLTNYLNDALSNGRLLDPNTGQEIPKHDDAIICCTANTMNGATGMYAGRKRQDKAFMNRFMMIAIDYDEVFETDLVRSMIKDCKDSDRKRDAMIWVQRIQKIRAAIARLGEQILCTPRASINGAKQIANNTPFTLDELEYGFVFSGVDPSVVKQIKEEAGVN
jgi:hypothetical protein